MKTLLLLICLLLVGGCRSDDEGISETVMDDYKIIVAVTDGTDSTFTICLRDPEKGYTWHWDRPCLFGEKTLEWFVAPYWQAYINGQDGYYRNPKSSEECASLIQTDIEYRRIKNIPPTGGEIRLGKK